MHRVTATVALPPGPATRPVTVAPVARTVRTGERPGRTVTRRDVHAELVEQPGPLNQAQTRPSGEIATRGAR